MKSIARQVLGRLGYTVFRTAAPPDNMYPADFTDAEKQTCILVRSHTQTSPERVVQLSRAVEHIGRNRVPGAIVECGVRFGGSAMAVCRTLLAEDDLRDIWLYDAWDRDIPAPSAQTDGQWLAAEWERYQRGEGSWDCPSLEVCRKNVLSTGYPAERVHFVKGIVEETLPGDAPETIALLRLDTDFYASTLHELVHLWPRLAPGGILIVDDYGYCRGCKKAVDEYMGEHAPGLFLARTDADCRVAVKAG